MTTKPEKITLPADGLRQDSTEMMEFSSDEESVSTLTDMPRITVTSPDGYHTPSTIFIPLDQHSKVVWFNSGDLIIRVGSVAFRVFAEMLARRSPMLAQLLTPAQLESCDSFEGARVIELWHKLCAVDVEHFLRAIFDPLSLNPNYKDNITFDAIAGVYEVSRHYRVQDFQWISLRMLCELYPTDLDEFLREQFVPAYCCDQIIPLIVFARKHRLDWLLPLAFYRLCLEFNSRALLYGVGYNGVVSRLSLEDQERCIDGHTAMHHTNAIELMDRYDRRLNEEGCTGGEECRKSRFQEGARLKAAAISRQHTIFHTWVPEEGTKLCESCLADARDWHGARREAFWKELPAMFGLPDWSRLVAMKEARLRPDADADSDSEEIDDEQETY